MGTQVLELGRYHLGGNVRETKIMGVRHKEDLMVKENSTTGDE